MGIAGADVVLLAEGNTDEPQSAWLGGPAGVGERGMCAAGSYGNLGDPVVSARVSGSGNPETNSRLIAVVPSAVGAKRRAREQYRQTKATK